MYKWNQIYRQAQYLVSYLPTRLRDFQKLVVRCKHDSNFSGKGGGTFLNSANHNYLEHIYKAWLKDRKSVHPSWDHYFQQIHAEKTASNPASTTPAVTQVAPSTTPAVAQVAPSTAPAVAQVAPSTAPAATQVAPSTAPAATQVAPSTAPAATQVAPSTAPAATQVAPSIEPTVLQDPASTMPALVEVANITPAILIGQGENSLPIHELTFTRSQAENFINGTLDIDATIRAYQSRGHLIADLDPLGIQNPDSAKLQGTANLPPAIVVREHLKGMTEADMDKEFLLTKSTKIGGKNRSLTLREIITRLNKVYCGHIGLEYTYINDPIMLDWIREKFEVPGAWELSAAHRKSIWSDVMKAVSFEGFLQKKYSSEKRFGLEGCEACIAAMVQIMETSAEKGVETVVIGMPHRGRLNTLVNVCAKPFHQLLTQFNPIALDGFGSGDVKYHLGTHGERFMERCKRKVHVAVMANPSHLETIDPVTVGRVRAEQVAKNDLHGNKSMAFLAHGDAAFTGQGVVFETMNLTNLPQYTTGGVIHMVVNNQIGFTTDPRYSRSSWHCTDVARVVNAPVFHVHGDNPDLVAYCSQVVAEYRATFHNDVVLDVVGYRRYGHNELDEPMLTQPIMYKHIKKHPNVLTVYTAKLIKEGVLTEAVVKEEIEKYLSYCEDEFKKAQTIQSMHMWDWHDIPWNEFFSNQNPKNKILPTGIDNETIKQMCNIVSTPPEGIKVHNVINRIMKKRVQMAAAGEIDWAMGESLAFLSLMKEGRHVRLSGQDVERGTFSHRMHVIHDQDRDKVFKNLLSEKFPGQALYTLSNSSLSEYGVCGFELGYSSYDHNTLTLWEGQFGDFANTSQVIMDCILSSGESKWGRQVGLVLLLPHGMEGQGPEHSSARIERYLQSCDDDVVYIPGTEPNASKNETVEEIMTRQLFEINWIVCNCTTPANFFHLLRRQMAMPFRKPLVVATPKSLLRHPMVISSVKEIGPGTTFRPMIGDSTIKPGGVKKVLFCTGKVYYELFKERSENKLQDKIAIVRIEQLCPFPYHLIKEEISKYPNPKFMWFQEEHKNQGPYYYVRDRIALALGVPLEKISYGGRPPSSSPATGNKPIYKTEHKDMMQMAMNLNLK